MDDVAELQHGWTLARRKARLSLSSATAIRANRRNSISVGPGPRPSTWLRNAATMRRWIACLARTAAFQALRALISPGRSESRADAPRRRIDTEARLGFRLAGFPSCVLLDMGSLQLDGKFSHLSALVL